MSHRSSTRSAVLTALLLIGLFPMVGAAPAAALPRKDDGWLQLRSPHFTFFSDASERTTRKIALDLEQLRSALAQLNPDLELASPVPTWIYVFKSTSSFAPYRLFYEGRQQSAGGYFVTHPYGNYVAINADPRRDATQLIYHEYLHHVLANNYLDLPLWLNEGLAEYYSTFAVVGGEAKVGLPLQLHVFWLRDNAMIPLPQLLEMSTDSRDYNEGSRRGVFYAESWALVHYLLNGRPERRQQTAHYLQELASGARSAEAFQKAFGDLHLLERDLRAYVRAGVFEYHRAPIAAEASVPLETAPLAWPDALYRLGDLAMHNGDEMRAAAEEHFRAALSASPGHGPARAGLGRIAQDAGRLAEARAHYEQAAQAAPDDFFVQYLRGVSLLEPAPDPGTLPQAQAVLRRAVELRPDFAEGWGRLAQALTYYDEFPPEALKVFETAYQLMPSRLDFAFNLALATARTGQRARAEKLIDEVLVPHGRDDLVEQAREAVFLGAWEEIEDRFVKPGKLAEAVPLFEALLPQAAAFERREDLERRLEELRDAVDYNSFADRYNRAIDFLNSGNDAEAITILEELASKTRNPGQAEEARALLEKIKSAPKRKG